MGDLIAKGRAHALAAPSSAKKWLRCSAAPYMEKDLHQEPTIFMEEGSVAHAVAEKCLNELKNPSEFIGQIWGSPAGMKIEVTQEMADAVQVYVDEVRKDSNARTAGVYIEEPLSIYPELCFGTADAVILTADTIIIHDFKYGAGIEVDAEENEQEMVYAVGALSSLRRRISGNIKTIELVITQPRHFKDADVKRWTIPVEELTVWKEFTLDPALIAIDEARHEFCVGDHCAYCAAAQRGFCPALKRKALSVVPAPAIALPENVQEYSPEQLAEVIGAEAAFKTWVKSVEKKFSEAKLRAKDMLSGGFTVPGYKLVAGRKSPPKYVDEAAAIQLAKEHGVDPYTTVVLSPAKLRDAFSDAGAPVDDLLALCEITHGVDIVPESNKKPALPVGPDAVFAGIE